MPLLPRLSLFLCSFLLLYVRVVKGLTKNADDFLVNGLEEVEPAYASFEGKMYAGRLPVNVRQAEAARDPEARKTKEEQSNSAEFMFWLFVPDTQSVPETITIFLNG